MLHRLASGDGMFCCSYEHLRMAFSELRGQLMHLTGKVSCQVEAGYTMYSLCYCRTLLLKTIPLVHCLSR